MKIFASAGTHKQQFNRLFSALDELVKSGKLKAQIFAQVGNSDYQPKKYPFVKFANDADYLAKINWADVVIGHAGAGLIVTALESQKPIVLVPRLKKFAEHTDDHQIDLAKKIAEIRKAVCVENVTELPSAIAKAQKLQTPTSRSRQILVEDLRKFLVEMNRA